MNRIEARQLDYEIRECLKKYSKEYGLNMELSDIIMDRYLEIIPDDTKRDMIFLGKESASYKLGNINLDLKSVLLAIADFVASLSQPESIFQYLQLAIVSVLCISTVVKKELDYNCAIVVYALHQLDAYAIKITMEQLKHEIETMKENYQIENFEEGRLEKNINDLLKWKVIHMENGKILLNEKVLGKIK